MKLSQAIREGCQLRPRVGQGSPIGERFSYVEERGLCSDIWGAAVEAVAPYVADFDWRALNVFAFKRAQDAFNAIQLDRFGAYFQMPARCPGAKQKIVKVGGRLIKRFGKEPELKTYDDYAKVEQFAGITTECQKVRHLAGMVDHLYRIHRMSPEDIAKCVEAYEDAREYGVTHQTAINQNFNHYQLNGG